MLQCLAIRGALQCRYDDEDEKDSDLQVAEVLFNAEYYERDGKLQAADLFLKARDDKGAAGGTFSTVRALHSSLQVTASLILVLIPCVEDYPLGLWFAVSLILVLIPCVEDYLCSLQVVVFLLIPCIEAYFHSLWVTVTLNFVLISYLDECICS